MPSDHDKARKGMVSIPLSPRIYNVGSKTPLHCLALFKDPVSVENTLKCFRT